MELQTEIPKLQINTPWWVTGSYDSSIANFLRSHHTVSYNSCIPVNIHINSARTFLQMLLISYLFRNGCSNTTCVSCYPFVFTHFHFWWLIILSIFCSTCLASVCLLWDKVHSDLLPIFKLDCFLTIELYEFFIYFRF